MAEVTARSSVSTVSRVTSEYPYPRIVLTSGNMPIDYHDIGDDIQGVGNYYARGHHGLKKNLRHYTTFGANTLAQLVYVKIFITELKRKSNDYEGNLTAYRQWIISNDAVLISCFPVPAGATFNFDAEFDTGLEYGLRISACDPEDLTANQQWAGGGWKEYRDEVGAIDPVKTTTPPPSLQSIMFTTLYAELPGAET